MSLHLPHRHHSPEVQPPRARTEYAIRDSAGGLLEWPCGCPCVFGTYSAAVDWSRRHGGDVVVKHAVTSTPWELA